MSIGNDGAEKWIVEQFLSPQSLYDYSMSAKWYILVLLTNRKYCYLVKTRKQLSSFMVNVAFYNIWNINQYCGNVIVESRTEEKLKKKVKYMVIANKLLVQIIYNYQVKWLLLYTKME